MSQEAARALTDCDKHASVCRWGGWIVVVVGGGGEGRRGVGGHTDNCCIPKQEQAMIKV